MANSRLLRTVSSAAAFCVQSRKGNLFLKFYFSANVIKRKKENGEITRSGSEETRQLQVNVASGSNVD